jgi:hypothetical protein
VNPYREELRNILADLETERPAALRRSRSERWLYATDLPMTASEDIMETFVTRAGQAGWTIEKEEGWFQLDRKVSVPLSGTVPAEWTACPAAACCRSLLERHRDRLTVSDGYAERMLVKAGEENPAAYEEACRKLHARWAEALRCRQKIPAVHLTFFGGGE